MKLIELELTLVFRPIGQFKCTLPVPQIIFKLALIPLQQFIFCQPLISLVLHFYPMAMPAVISPISVIHIQRI